MSWSAFHTACESPSTVLTAITAMLPLFHEKARHPSYGQACQEYPHINYIVPFSRSNSCHGL